MIFWWYFGCNCSYNTILSSKKLHSVARSARVFGFEARVMALEKSAKSFQKWKWWRAHFQYLNKIFYVHLINIKVRDFLKNWKIRLGKNFYNHFSDSSKQIKMIYFIFWSDIAYVCVITFIFEEFLLLFLKVSHSYVTVDTTSRVMYDFQELTSNIFCCKNTWVWIQQGLNLIH